MTRVQIVVLVITAAGAVLAVLFPPWVAIQEGSLGEHRDPYCCLDHPLWSPPEPPAEDHLIRLDWPRLTAQLAPLLGAGVALVLIAGRIRKPGS